MADAGSNFGFVPFIWLIYGIWPYDRELVTFENFGIFDIAMVHRFENLTSAKSVSNLTEILK
jgi:hypothetical protein